MIISTCRTNKAVGLVLVVTLAFGLLLVANQARAGVPLSNSPIVSDSGPFCCYTDFFVDPEQCEVGNWSVSGLTGVVRSSVHPSVQPPFPSRRFPRRPRPPASASSPVRVPPRSLARRSSRTPSRSSSSRLRSHL